MDDNYTKAIRAIKPLSTDELAKLRNFIAGLIAQGPSSADRVVTSLNHDDWVLMGIVDYIRKAGMPPVKIETMLTSPQYSTFKAKAEGVRVYLAKAGDKNHQRALLRVGLMALHKNMTEQRIAISYLTFMTWIHRLPGSINREFPGYMESNHLPLIIRGDEDVRQKQGKRSVQRARDTSTGE